MLRRQRRPPVLAEIPAPQSSGARPGALGRAELAAYSGLATALAASRVVLATGPAKSNLALGLAAASIATGKHVALLECDLASPSLAGLLGLSKAPGLHEYLRGEAEAPGILQSLVLAGPASGRAIEPLACIVAGAPEPAPVALLDSELCDHAIARLRRAYDLLVIDGPPLSEAPDSLRALHEHADTTLVCGGRSEIPKRLPVAATGLVLAA
jgi:Mrp family chromosome partitioning ATPase